MNNRFTCEKCNQNFEKGWSEEEAKKEFATADWNIPGDEIALICDDCFEEFKVWFDTLTPEQHAIIRDEVK